MADFVELANSYYRLLRWVEASEVDKKNTALRSLDRIKRFLDESNLEVVDLTGQPFSEGWAVKVMKIDDTVPENELVFTKMVKPIIQINGELSQEGEVYVGKLDLVATEEKDIQEPVENAEAEGNIPASGKEKSSDTSNQIAQWFRNNIVKCKDLNPSSWRWIIGSFGVVALIILLLIGFTLGGNNAIRSNVAAVDRKIEELSLGDYRNQLGENANVTYEIRNGENKIIVTQPIGASVNFTVDWNGNPVTITTNNSVTTEGE